MLHRRSIPVFTTLSSLSKIYSLGGHTLVRSKHVYRSKAVIKPHPRQKPLLRRDILGVKPQASTFSPRSYAAKVLHRLWINVRMRRWLFIPVCVWLTVTIGCWTYNVCVWIRHREIVPISGRERFAGTPELNRALCERLNQFREEMSQNLKEGIAQGEPLRKPPEAMRRVSTILRSILSVAGLDKDEWSIIVINRPAFEAEIDESHRIIVLTTGFFALATSNSEMAAVLAHEVAHYLCGHARETETRKTLEKRYELTMLPATVLGGVMIGVSFAIGSIIHESLAILALPGFLLVAPRAALYGLERRNCRIKETEADRIGLLLMIDAGYEPMAMVNVLRKLRKLELATQYKLNRQRRPQDFRNRTSEWKSTHPYIEKRIVDIQCQLPRLGKIVEAARLENGMASSQGQDPMMQAWITFVTARNKR